MLSQIEFRVVESANESLEQMTHQWIREALFFIGASWYVNRKEFKTVYQVSEKLKLRWLFSHNRIKVAIEQKERHRNWMGTYSIGNQDAFVLDCNSHDDTGIVERIVKAYLPKIEIVQCAICGTRFGNELTEDGWRCADCTRDFSYVSRDKIGFVYIFGSVENGYYKIGCGSNPMARLRDYRLSKLPFPVEMIHIIPVDDKLKAEAELHRLYREQRTNGEWFKLSEDDLTRIKGLSRYIGGYWSTVDPTPAYGGAM